MLKIFLVRFRSNPQLLVSRIYNGLKIRFPRQNLSARGKGTHWAFGLNSVLQSEKLFNKNCAWKIGNGRNVRASLDQWVNGEVPSIRDGICINDISRKKVSDFFLPNTTVWDHRKIQEFYEPQSARLISQIETRTDSTQDFMYWKYNGTSIYTVKSGYFTLMKHNLNLVDNLKYDMFYRKLWSLDLIPKFKIFIWKICTNSLALCKNLWVRNITDSPLCCICNIEDETATHLFRNCSFAKNLWQLGTLGIISDQNISTVMTDWVMDFILLFINHDGSSGSRHLHFIFTLWTVWLA